MNKVGLGLVMMMMMMMMGDVWVWLAPVVRLGWSGPVPLTELKPLSISKNFQVHHKVYF